MLRLPYLYDLIETFQDFLFSNRTLILVVFRSLTPLAKTLAFRLLFCEHQIHLDKFCFSKIERLVENKLFEISPHQDSSKDVMISLNQEFRARMLSFVENKCILHNLTYKVEHLQSNKDCYSSFEWDETLFILGNPNLELNSKNAIDLTFFEKVFIKAGLWTNSSKLRYSITPQGIKFLLADIHEQLWFLILELSRINFGLQNSFTNLPFVTKLAFFKLNRYCVLNILYPFEKSTVKNLTLTSIEFFDKRKSLNNDRKVDQIELDGFIVVETNFRIYGYTTNLMRSALLRFFSKPECLLPNLYVGLITRNSCQMAFDSGISADTILSFIRKNAHPETFSRTCGVLPEAVSDQVRLWEFENFQLYTEPALLLDNFGHIDLFRRTEIRAIELGIKIFSSLSKQLLVVRSSNDYLIKSLMSF
jgi:transcription initiation factor TFIIH subunit 4